MAAVASHRPWDSTEAGHLARLRRLLSDDPGPFDAGRFSPGHVTASGFVLHPDENAVALVEHAGLLIWVQPGGHVEPGDPTVEAGARREVTEEIGISGLQGLGLLDVDVHRYPARGDRPPHLHFDVRWGFRAHEAHLRAGDGVRTARWIPLPDAAGMDESIARPVRKLASEDW